MRILFFLALVFSLALAVAEAKPAKAKRKPKGRLMPVGICPIDPEKASFSPQVIDGAVEIFQELAERYGPCESVSWAGKGALLLKHKHAEVPLDVRTTGGTIRSFTVRPARYPGDSLEKIRGHLQELGASALLVSAKGERLLELEPARRQNVGDARRLLLAAALQDRYEKGALKPSTVVAVSVEAGATGPGFLKDWPVGLPVTIDTLVTLMLQERDGGASDLLLEAVGRQRDWLKGPGPFLSWREYVLLMRANTDELNDFRRRPEDALARMSKRPGRVSMPPLRSDRLEEVGWFSSAERLCAALATLPDDPRLALGGYFGDSAVGLFSSASGVGQITLREKGLVGCLSITLSGKSRQNAALAQEMARRLLNLLGKEAPQIDETEDR